MTEFPSRAGATVTATQGKQQFVAVTDTQGASSFPELAEGPFTIQVEMLGFSTIKQEGTGSTAELELKMLPIEEMHAEVVHAPPSEPAPAPAQASPKSKQAASQQPRQPGFQRTEMNTAGSNPAPATSDTPCQSGAFVNLSPEDLSQSVLPTAF